MKTCSCKVVHSAAVERSPVNDWEIEYCPKHAAVDELVEACETYRKMNACYRIGSRPSEALHDAVQDAAKLLDRLKVKPVSLTVDGGANVD